ncbi:MAG: rhodanese-like domain-containing protein [Bacteroidota bacterium]
MKLKEISLYISDSGMKHISPKDAYSIRLEDLFFLDIRKSEYVAYKKIDSPNILYFEYPEIINQIHELPKDKAIIVVDSSGVKSKFVVEEAIKQGYSNFINLIGGILEWDKDGIPLIIDLDEELHGQCACRLTAKRKLNKFKN